MFKPQEMQLLHRWELSLLSLSIQGDYYPRGVKGVTG